MRHQPSTTTERNNEQTVSSANIVNQPELARLLFNIKDTAQMLSVSEKSVRRLLERGLLKANPALRIKLITGESIQAFARMTL